MSLRVYARPIATPVKWGLALAVWYVLNLTVSLANELNADMWLRFAFPALLFPFSLMLGWTHFRSEAQRRRITIWIMLVGTVAIATSLAGVQQLSVGDVTDLQSLRKLGGDYYAPLTTTLVLPFLVTAEGRRIIRWPASSAILLLGLIGLALSFTRTYWLSTTVSTLLLLVLLARFRSQDLGRLALIAPVLLGVGAAIVVPKLPPNLLDFVFERVASITQIADVSTVQYRLVESLGLLRTQAEEPISFIAGNGFGASFFYEFVHPSTGVVHGGAGTQYAHNYYLYLLLVVGVTGLVLFLGLWISALGTILGDLRRSGKRADVLLPVRLAVLTASANLLVASVTTPHLENFQFPLIFGLLLMAGMDSPPGGLEDDVGGSRHVETHSGTGSSDAVQSAWPSG
jgi:O-antigen ligase